MRIKIFFLFFFFFYSKKSFCFESKYFNFSFSKQNKTEAISIDKKSPNNKDLRMISFKHGQEKQLIKNEIQKFLHQISNLNLKGEQFYSQDGENKSGKVELSIDKPKEYVEIKYKGEKNDKDNYILIREKNEALFLDKNTNQKTNLERKGGIEDIFLKNDKSIENLMMTVGVIEDKTTPVKQEIISCFHGVEDEIFCLIFDRKEIIKEKKIELKSKEEVSQKENNNTQTQTKKEQTEMENEKEQMEREHEVKNSILNEKQFSLEIKGLIVHHKMMHSEIKINQIGINEKDANASKEENHILIDKKLQDE